MHHCDLAELVLDESGYTEMWQNDKSLDAPGRLENLKELIVAMDEFETLGGFLEHVSLVMEAAENRDQDQVNVMTLHSAKGLEFDTVFLAGWEEGLFPNQRALDETGLRGLEEERRLAYVGLTRARKRADRQPRRQPAPARQLGGGHSFALRRRAGARRGGARERSRPLRQRRRPFGWRCDRTRQLDWTPPWFEAWSETPRHPRHGPGAPDARRTGRVLHRRGAAGGGEPAWRAIFAAGDRVFHQKFGYGTVRKVEGERLHHRLRPGRRQEGHGELRRARGSGRVTPLTSDQPASSCGVRVPAESPSRSVESALQGLGGAVGSGRGGRARADGDR